MDRTLPINRRRFVALAGVSGLAAAFPARLAFAAAQSDRRFVFIIQRGAADGLATVIPHAEPALSGLRGALSVDAERAIALDGTFSLHPELAHLGDPYRKGEAAFVHAVATRYRERSHFDAQNLLETGAAAAHARRDGWMNRLVGLVGGPAPGAVAISPSLPLALRGSEDVTSFAPSRLHGAPEDVIARAEDLYAGDPALASAWQAALANRPMGGESDADGGPEMLGSIAPEFLVRPDGPRLAMIELDGWGTHAQQARRLSRKLSQLDRTLAALKLGLGAEWARTVVVIATEFGRTVAINGTGGTDHGTAGVAMLVGGAVRGGRVIADWPGPRPADLYEGRDLMPTAGLEALIAAVSAECFSLDPERTAQELFGIRPAGSGYLA